MNLDQHSLKAIREFIGGVPEHIENCAAACAFDLINGPSFVVIPDGNVVNFDGETYMLRSDAEDAAEEGDEIEETYTGQVGDALRDFIGTLPSVLWIDTDCGYVTDAEPDSCEECYECNGSGIAESGFYDADESTDELPVCDLCNGEGFVEVDLSDWYSLDTSELVEILFGRTISREFS